MNSAKPALRHWHGWLLALGAGACLLPSLHAATTGCYSAPAGLAGWWPGDGNANDIAGANNGTLLGGATAVGVGTVGSAFSFDGANGYVQIPDSTALRPTNLTVEAWVRFNSLDTAGTAQAGQQYIIFKQNTRSSYFEGYYIGKVRTGGGDVFTFIAASALSPAAGQMAILQSATVVTPGVWYHVAGVRGTNYAELYVNGQLESRTNATFTQDYGNFPLYFGTSGQSYWDRKFSGLLDEVSLYNRALSSNEVAAIYAAGAGGKCKAPGITTDPSSQAVFPGSNVVFTVTATGFGALGYQWRFNGAAISGQTGASLTLTNVQSTNTGNYTAVVTNSLGAATSAVATLTVWVPPVISGQPQSRTNILGTDANFSVIASGTPVPAYQWEFNGAAIPGATGSTLLRSAVPLTDAGDYRVVLTNLAGAVTSDVATLTVWASPVVSGQPQSRTNIVRTDASFSVTATGTPPPAYQWEFNGAAVPGATGSGLLRSAVGFADAGSYRVVLTNIAGRATSDVAALTVVCPSVSISPTQLPNGVLNGAYAQNLSGVGGNGPYSFAVTAGVLPPGLQLSAAGSFSGAPSTIGTNSFSVTTTDTNGCTGSQSYTLAVPGVPPLITLQPLSRTNILGTDASFGATASGTPTPAYQWEFNGAAIPGATGSALLRSAVSFAEAGGYRLVASNAAGVATSQVATLVVVCPPITVSPSTLPDTVLGISYSQNLTAGGGNGAYTFAVTAGTLPTGLSLSSAGALTGTPTVIGTNGFTVTATDTNGCSGNQAYSLAVTGVPPLITLQPQDFTAEVGTTATLNVTATGTAPLSYQWLLGGTSLVNDGRITGATSDTLQIAGLLTNDTGSYTVIISNVAGMATSMVAAVSVVQPAACASPAPGLVGWWPGEASANDVAGTNNGTLQGTANASAVGRVGLAFGLDGTNGYVRIPDAPALRPTNLTIEAWVWFKSLDTLTWGNSPVGEQYLVFKESTHPEAFEGYALTKARVAGRDVFDIAVSSAAGQTVEVTSQTLVVTGAWYHVAGVRGSNYLQLYVNGQLEAQSSVSFPQDYGNYPLLFGTSGQPTWDHRLAGRLDEVSLYNRALSSNEIAAIYAAGGEGKCKAATITAQPQSKTVGAGSTVLFSVTASGSPPLMYRWQREGVPLSNGNNISGAYSPTLSLANVTTNDTGNYRVVITNSVGAATSAVAVLTVVPALDPPKITVQPGSQSAAAGTNLTFSVQVSGTAPFGYQWRFAGTNLTTGAQYSGATGPVLSISYVLPANSGAYTVVVTNGAGAVTSAVATLTVSVPNGCLPPPAGLVGWWPGDGSARDIVGTNNGTLMGNAIANGSGIIGQAFSFDGTNGYARIPDSPTFHPTNLTVECWVRFAAYQTPGNTYYPNQQYIVFKQNSRVDEFEGFALTKDHDPQGDVFLWEVASASGELIRIDTVSTVVTGVWYHVVGVRGTNYVQLYKDGQLEVQSAVDFPQDYGTNPLYFGTSGQPYYDRRLHADLDEVALYDRALSADEIATLYAAGAAGKCKGTNGVNITLQPRSEAVLPGSTVTLSAAATGLDPLGFQWQLNGAAIVAATKTSLTLTNVQPTNAGNYRVVVSNPAGSVISDTATLSVGSPPVLLDPRTSPNGTFSFTVSGTSGLSYVIEFSTNFHDWTALTSVTAIAGQAVFTDTIPPNGAARFYRARLSY